VRQLQTIAQREAGAFFHSAMAPVVITGFLILTGLFFTLFTFGYSEMSLNAIKSGRANPNLNLSEGVFQPLVADMTVFLLFLLPAITMRLFSEEYRSGRYDLIMSYPVADHIWVYGKFLSVLAAALVLILSSGVYFGVAAWLGHPEPGPLFAAAIGLILLTATIAAWGIFFSTLFQYQVISYFLTFAFVLLFYTLGGLEPHLPYALGRLSVELSLADHFVRFSRGVVDSRDIVFFCGFTILGLFAATGSLASRRMALGRRWLRWLPTVILAAFLVLLYIIALKHPLTLDWTRNQRYSLAPQTKQVLRALDKDVTVHAFYQRLDPYRKAVEVLLRACRDNTPRLRFEMVDPDRDLGLVQEYGITKARTVILEAADRRAELLLPDEKAFINTLYRLATGTRPVIYYLLGHGEHRLDSDDRGGYTGFTELLSAQGYEVRALVLAEKTMVPPDADMIVIAAPKLDYTRAEIALLDDFVLAGGALLAMLDPDTPDTLSSWTERYNVKLGNDLIVTASGARRQFGVDQRVVVIYDTYAEHPVTRGLEGLPTLFPYTQSLSSLRRSQPGLLGKAILVTDTDTWAKKTRTKWVAGQLQFEEGVDQPGPLAFGVALEVQRSQFQVVEKYSSNSADESDAQTGTGLDKPPDAPSLRTRRVQQASEQTGLPASIFTQAETSRLVFLGDSDFAVNENLNLYGNRDLLLNILGWLAREQVLIALRSRGSVGEPVVLTVAQKEFIGWMCILGWPALLGTGSLAMVIRHRRRR